MQSLDLFETFIRFYEQQVSCVKYATARSSLNDRKVNKML